MTPPPLETSRPSPIPELPLLAGMLALASIAGGVAHSLTAAIAACVVAAVSWRLGLGLAVVGALVGLAGTLLSAPPAGSAEFYTVLSGASALLLVAAVGPAIYLPRASRTLRRSGTIARRVTPTSTSPPPLVGASRTILDRQREAPIRVAPPPDEFGDEDARADPDVIRRYLRDARDALGADEVIFWRHDPLDGSFEVAASSGETDVDPEVAGNPRLMALVRWAATERIVTTNDDAEPALFVTGPVGKAALLHGALGIYAANRRKLPKERAKPWLGRYASHLAGLLELLEEGRTARRYRDRARTYVQASERIQNNRDLPALGRAICETSVQVTSASRAAFILWDAVTGTGQVHTVSPGHPVPEQFPVTADSLVATACRERQRFAIPELRASAQRVFYGQGEAKRNIGSIGIVHLERGHASVGAIAVEGDAAAQISAVEVETLMLLATAASVAFETTLQFAQESERARQDGLTGLANRRVFDERLGQLLAESDRYGHPTSLILVDVDFFKKVNDRYGHEGGDTVLRHVAQTVNSGIRTIDLCARYGGEELAILLPSTALPGAVDVAERLRRAVAASPGTFGGETIPVTASFGVACFPESVRIREAFFPAADRALYDAKRAGRNCVRSAAATPSGRGT